MEFFKNIPGMIQESGDDKEAPKICARRSRRQAAKLKKFSDAGGRKACGCPTSSESILESRAV